MKNAKRGRRKGGARRKDVLAEEVWLMPRKEADVLRAVVCCPSRYDLAMSSLGMWSLFGSLNGHPAFVPERLVSERSAGGGAEADDRALP